MTVIEIAKTFNLQPKDVTAFIQTNATFPVKRNFQTGEISIPDDIDIKTFIAPLVESIHREEQEKANRIAQQQREAAERAAQQRRLAAEQAAQQQRAATELRLHQEDLARQNKEASYAVEIEKLKNNGAEGYYEYKVISLVDEDGGYIDIKQLTTNLNALGVEGWHLVSAYSNEIGHTSSSSGYGGYSTGTNATVDQNILIFERFVRF